MARAPHAASSLPTAAFQSLGLLRALNVLAVGLALGAGASSAFARAFDDPSLGFAIAAGGSTWIVGTLWAVLLRWQKAVGSTTFRWGWAASVPLAMLNASLVCSLTFGGLVGSGGGKVGPLDAMIAGATVGGICWVPALLATLLCFGAPIAWSQRLAGKGLAGEERGEWIVGVACLVVSIVAFLAAPPHDPFVAAVTTEGRLVPITLAVAGGLLGGVATLLALAREDRRRRFVLDAEAGKIAGFRVDPTQEGKVLVRIASRGEGYRVADAEEEVFELDADGAATRPKQAFIF
jgi:hypothetical protein